MNADQLLTNFDHVAVAPSGIKRLRELVLHLAVSGRLAPRQSSERDGAASVVEAAALKDAYRVKHKHKLKPSGSDRPMAETELEFEIPAHWKWERLGNIACYIQRGKSPKYDDVGTTRVVSQKCVQWSGFDLSLARRISDESVEDYSNERFLVGGDILLNSTGTGTVGRVSLYPGAEEQVVVDSHVTIVRLTNFVPAYVWCYLVSPIIQQRMIPGQENSMVTGTTNQVELSAAKISELPIPCPPVAEQKRIVAKVGELMALCDQLEVQQQERQRRFPELSRTCHAYFVEAPTLANLNRIFEEADTVSADDLRRTILSLAIHGRISKQQPGDGSVESTLPALASRALKTNDEGYPTHWRQVKLGDVGVWKGGGTPSKSVPEYWIGTMPWVSPKDMKKLRISDAADHISEAAIESSSVQLIPENSLLMVVRGMILARAFPVALTTRAVTINQDMKAVLPHDPNTAEFLLLSLRAFEPLVLSLIERSSHGTCKLLTEVLHALPIPIPPLAEQRRIVAKVDELMALVDQLEMQQQERDRLAETFAKACVASFTGTTKIETPKEMKAPKTELVSFVTLGKKPKRDAKAPLAKLLTQNEGTLPAKSLWQQSGLTIDAFYQQLKTEIAHGWITPPVEAEMKVVEEG